MKHLFLENKGHIHIFKNLIMLRVVCLIYKITGAISMLGINMFRSGSLSSNDYVQEQERDVSHAMIRAVPKHFFPEHCKIFLKKRSQEN